MPLDERLLRIAVAKNPNAQRVLVAQVRPLVKEAFEERKAEFLRAFDADEVTKEIEAGPFASSHVPELKSINGNLFSLLGFYQEQNPTAQLRDYLESNVVLYKTSAGQIKGDKIRFDTSVLAPSEEDIDTVMANNPDSSLEWSPRAWTSLLARGISGLPKYLVDLVKGPTRFARVPSRSGPAIQTKGTLRSGQVGPIPYIARLLGVLKRQFPKRR